MEALQPPTITWGWKQLSFCSNLFAIINVRTILSTWHLTASVSGSGSFWATTTLLLAMMLTVVFHFLTLQTLCVTLHYFCVNVNKLACKREGCFFPSKSLLFVRCVIIPARERTFMGWCRNHPIKCDLGTTNFSAKMQSSFLLRICSKGNEHTAQKGKMWALPILLSEYVCVRCWKVNLI